MPAVPAPPTLSATTALDRLSARRGDRAFIATLLKSPQARIIALVGPKPVIRSTPDRTQATLAQFTPADWPAGPPGLEDLLFMGVSTKTGAPLFAAALTPEAAARIDPDGHTLAPAVDVRSLAMQGVLSPADLATAATASALFAWHDTSRFCGACASPTEPRDAGWARHCKPCGRSLFPRTDPVVIMLVTAGDHCVLARQAAFPEGMVSTLAGFLEPGETIEAAVTRETAEEIGVNVDAVRYLASQPWPFPHSLMIGCLAEARHQPLNVDPGELETAQWVSRAQVRQMLENTPGNGPWIPGPHAIARWLIARFAADGAMT